MKPKLKQITMMKCNEYNVLNTKTGCRGIVGRMRVRENRCGRLLKVNNLVFGVVTGTA